MAGDLNRSGVESFKYFPLSWDMLSLEHLEVNEVRFQWDCKLSKRFCSQRSLSNFADSFQTEYSHSGRVYVEAWMDDSLL